MYRHIIIGFVLVAAACSGTPERASDLSSPTHESVANGSPSETRLPDRAEPDSQVSPGPASCDIGEDPQPWTPSLTATAQTILQAEGIRVDAVVYPHPDYQGKPWSQWGQGIIVEDGRFFSAIGDHHGADGNSFLYEFDPQTRELTLFADLNTVIGHQAGSWGYGKVHAQMVEGPCGFYVASYWGSRRNLVFDDHYRGDRLLLVDPHAETIAEVSVIFPGHGVPSMASNPSAGLLFAEAVDPLSSPNTGPFLVLDEGGSEVFRSEGSHAGFRSIAVDALGRAYFSLGEGGLARYDPDTNSVEDLGAVLPGDILRAATTPAPDGTIYGVTRTPPRFFSLDETGAVEVLGEARGYTTSLALAPDGSTVYYVPYAHGGAADRGTPLVAVDTTTGQERQVALLNEAAETALGLRLGGTYNIAIDDAGTTIYLGMNAGPAGSEEGFGEVVLLVIELIP